jgi:hypothetical protein
VEARSFVSAGGDCIAGGCVVFSVLTLSACFCGMNVHFAVSVIGLVVSVSSSYFSSATSSAMASCTTSITSVGVSCWFGGRISDFLV